MEGFVSQLLDLVFFVFSQHDNVIVLVPFAVLLFCFSMALIRRLIRRV